MYVNRFPRRANSPFNAVWGMRERPPRALGFQEGRELAEHEIPTWWNGKQTGGGPFRSPARRRLRIVHINDTHHMHLGQQPTRAHDSAADKHEEQRPPVYTVANYLAAARRDAQKEETDLLYLSAGDEHTGTSLDELLGYTVDSFFESTGYALQSVLGLDAAAIGNHDLDRGPAILQKAIAESASFPVLSANIRESRYLIDYYAALIGETNHGVSVGIVAVTTDEQLDVRSALDPDFSIEDPVEASLRWYRRIAPSVDVVIVLSHLGLNVPGSRHQSNLDDRVLATTLAEEEFATGNGSAARAGGPLTLIIGGHTHTIIDPTANPVVVAGIPVFQAGCNADYLGDIEIDITMKSARGKIVAINGYGTTERSGHRAASRDLDTLITGTLTRLRSAVLTPVAAISQSGRADTVTTLTDRLSGECAIANMITDALRVRYNDADAGTSVVFACDASGIQSGLTEKNSVEGILRIDDLYRILPYADSIYRAVLAPAELVSILHSNALRRIPADHLESNGGEIGLLDWSRIARGYLHFSRNLRYMVAGLRDGETPHDTTSDITLDGKSIEDFPAEHEIVLYCNSFSALGNQGWSERDGANFREFGAVSLPELGFQDTGEPLRAALIESLMEAGFVSIARDGRVRVYRHESAEGDSDGDP